MAAPGQEQLHHGPPKSSRHSACPVARVFECDDLLGKIYTSLERSEDRRSLRHCSQGCYRSPAINSRITSFTIGSNIIPMEKAVRDAMAALAAFPQHAQLRKLKVSYQLYRITAYPCIDSLLEVLFPELLRPAGAAVRERLLNVDTLVLEYCSLTSPSSAAALASLFPGLNAPTLPPTRPAHAQPGQPATSKLVLNCCSSNDLAFGKLAAELSGLRELEVESWPEGCVKLEQALTRFSGLVRLKIISIADDLVKLGSVQPLTALGKLEGLEFEGHGHGMEGLEEVLERLPLRSLSLLGVVFRPCAPRLQSASLRSLDINVNSSSPVLSPQDFPQLQVLRLHGTFLYGPGPTERWGTEEDQLRMLEERVLSISEFPGSLLALPSFRSWFEPEGSSLLQTFEIAFDSNDYARPGAYPKMLKLLAPLTRVMASVERLQICCFQVCVQGLHATASSFPGLVNMQMLGEYVGNEVSDAVVMLPRLQRMHLEVQRPPDDLICCLTIALTAGRRLCLHLSGCPRDTSFLALKKQWDAVRRRLPAACSVVLK